MQLYLFFSPARASAVGCFRQAKVRISAYIFLKCDSQWSSCGNLIVIRPSVAWSAVCLGGVDHACVHPFHGNWRHLASVKMLLPTTVSRGQLLAQMACTEALGTDGVAMSSLRLFQTEPEAMLWAHWAAHCVQNHFTAAVGPRNIQLKQFTNAYLNVIEKSCSVRNICDKF